MEVTKWGFGAAPFKEKADNKNKFALITIDKYLSGEKIQNEKLCECISHVKGMFNRIKKQNQWDWFTTSMYFDYPTSKDIGNIVTILSDLRNAITQKDYEQQEHLAHTLEKSNIRIYINNYLNFNPNDESGDEYIYILSRKEEKELLKVGMTRRNVVKRCQEINSATGVVYPFSPRAVYRVNNAKKAEKEIHKALDQWRVRNDREFFLLDYKLATYIIEKVLFQQNLFYNKYGNDV